jgi:hypothetical protein
MKVRRNSMKKFLSITAAALVAATATQAFAAQVVYRLDTPDSTHWSVSAMDSSNTDNLGIKFFGFTLTASGGTITSPTTFGTADYRTAPRGQDAGADQLGFTSAAASPTTVSGQPGFVFNLDQGSGGTVVFDAAVLGVGQGAASPLLGYTTPGGLQITGLLGQSINDIGGFVQFAKGTNSPGAALSISGAGATVFNLTQPNDGGAFTAIASNSVVTAVQAVPEPASLALLGLGGLLILVPRKRAR